MADDALAGLGSSIAAFRRGARLTQRDLAGRVGMSVQWVSGVEQGRLRADRLRELIGIASAVGCAVPDLLGGPVDTLTSPRITTSDMALDRVRSVVLRSVLPDAVAGPDPTDVADRADQALALWHESPAAYTALGAVLPDLLTDALACHQHAQDKRAAARALAEIWQITRNWLYHIPGGEGELAWFAADRSLAAAQDADDPHLIALGQWAVAGVYRQMGEPGEAVRLCLAAADAITPLLDASRPDQALLSTYGSLHLTASLSAAASGGDGRAWALHRVAEQASTAAGPGFDSWTAFGPTEVGCRAIAIHERLGNVDAVVENVPRLDLGALPSTHRRACVLIDLGKAHARRGEDEAAVRALLDAEQASTDVVRYSGGVRDTVRDLLLRDRAGARPHVRGLARRIGLIAA
jgi:transcriptional regulator with XRE-family HTH domain